MDSGMAGPAARGDDNKGPAMIPFLSACFAELRARGAAVMIDKKNNLPYLIEYS